VRQHEKDSARRPCVSYATRVQDRGIFASGKTISGVKRRFHWKYGRRKKALYVKLKFDRVLDPRKVLLLLTELRRILRKMKWTPKISGIEIPKDVAAKLEKRWTEFYRQFGKKLRKSARSRAVKKNDLQLPEEADINKEFMRFEDVYGKIGRGYIHVHHLVPPSAIGKRYRLNPKRDLRPVCANCHAMIDRRDPPYTIDELKHFYKQHNT
jgi:hypothetical protein